MEDILKHLNPAQAKAVKNYKGPSLVIAGAGSGKTRVLTYRIAYLLLQGVQPYNILALTFTNKAASEMKDRIAGMVGEQPARQLWMGTFHSIFAKILRKEHKTIGYSRNFSIYDMVDSKNLIKKILKEWSLDDKTYKPFDVMKRISTAKNNLVTWKSYCNNGQIIKQDEKARRPKICDIYRTYALRCKKADAMDFDDLLLNINILFRDHPEILAKYQNQFKYILVDEYQDTNFAQYLIVKKIGEKHKNVCVVGDDAQSIYSFRGAKVENILNFKNDYKNYQLFKLEQNYRSTQTIVDAANSMIRKNVNQIQKEVFSKKDKGEKIEIMDSQTDGEEAFNIAHSIADSINSNGNDYKDFAILYRTNAQSRKFEEALRKLNMPYKVYGGIGFYQRKEIKDLLAYFRLGLNFNDEEALLRIINFPARGIGKTTLDKVTGYARANDLTIWEVLNSIDKVKIDFNRATREKLKRFTALIRQFSEVLQQSDAYDAAMTIASRSGILEEFEEQATIQDESKYENIQELLNGIKDYVDHFGEEELPTLNDFMENVSLMTNADLEDEDDINKITIMTMHSAKGLEFNTVFLTGMEEGLFPSMRSITSEKDLEEERRLFYVALTRAERKAVISYARSRYKWGTNTLSNPSRFIKDIEPGYVEYPAEAEDILPKRETAPENPFSPTFVAANSSRKLKKIERKEEKNVPSGTHLNGKYDGKLKAGMIVEHTRFGRGKIVDLEGAMPHTKATILFNKHGQKQLLLKFAKLKIIS